MTASRAAEMKEIASLRRAIDHLDIEIARLLLRRAKLSFSVRTRKKDLGRAVRDSERESEIVSRYARHALKNGASVRAMESCASSILSFSRKFNPTR